MDIYHKHHIIPKHLGGTDEESNLILVTIEEHAEIHRKMYEKHGRWQDYVAWKGLLKQLDKQEITKIKLSESGKKGAALSAKPWWTNGTKNIRSNTYPGEGWRRGRLPLSAKHKENISKAHIGSKKAPYPTAICSHCGKETTKSNIIRWHEDKCKMRVE